ncbi:3-hydroxyisobutyrate dehydrogenase [Caballeronia temeraria]|uniref:3-hydroxyisobutyrate dehydrogenase n=1 Tax=Caballeronia temeraria TaxID=1777137 RepID=A0A158DJD1_9BURK|nr:NAD(P)-dependent oxidoreductase [Caballeronia temeraria]SAK94731.1 3-hydroxyisobutyrate dehydrogenase [Caballeronia temeraria]
MIKSVGVIGVGSIGAPIAKRIHGSGYELTVCDVNGEALKPFAAAGVKVTTHPRDLAGVDLVLVLVASAKQVEAVVCGADGIVAPLGGSPGPVIAIMSTVGPTSIKAIEQWAIARNVRVIDAPVSGGVRRAELGTLSVLIAGSEANVAFATPVFQCLGKQLFYFDAIGKAQVVKVANNMIACANLLASAEAFRMAIDYGIDLDAFTDVAEASSGRSSLSATRGDAQVAFASWTETRSTFDSLLSILKKDMRLAQECASDCSGSFPMLELLNSGMERAGGEAFNDWRAIASYKNTEARDGTTEGAEIRGPDYFE